eukprot:6464574-Amphidinium_carterae.1
MPCWASLALKWSMVFGSVCIPTRIARDVMEAVTCHDMPRNCCFATLVGDGNIRRMVSDRLNCRRATTANVERFPTPRTPQTPKKIK